MIEKNINSRIQNKHDLEANWIKAVNFIPKQGEIIVYDCEIDSNGNTLLLPDTRTSPYSYERLKIGDGINTATALPFIDETFDMTSAQITHEGNLLSNLINTYLLSIDYDSLAFDINEIVIGNVSTTTAILGRAILGQLILA